jgi:putative spermidine/putrescine transport system permease protein
MATRPLPREAQSAGFLTVTASRCGVSHDTDTLHPLSPPAARAEGLLNYLGPQGWFNRTLLWLGIISHPIRLLRNYWGVFASLLITGFPFTFLLTLSYVSGIDPALEKAAATLGANARRRFLHIFLPLLVPGLAINFCLSFM